MIKIAYDDLAQLNAKTITEVSNETGISRATLTNLSRNRAKGLQFKTIDRLCKYFNCDVGDLIKFKND